LDGILHKKTAEAVLLITKVRKAEFWHFKVAGICLKSLSFPTNIYSFFLSLLQFIDFSFSILFYHAEKPIASFFILPSLSFS